MDFKTVFSEQKKFFATHKTKDVGFRKENLAKLKKLLEDNEEALAAAIYKDFKKSAKETYLTELSLLYREIDFYLKNLEKLSRPEKVGTPLILQPGRSRIYREPLGATLVIGAWNYPYQLTLLPAISAMAAGNTCMLKPSELPENTMNAMAELINGNFPQEYLFVAKGGVPETTELLKLRFDKIFFTGSPKVGKIVYEAAAKNLVPVVLELGGKSPAIITESADMEVAARRIVWAKFLNAGQTCIAPDYLLVEESAKEKFLVELIKKLDEYQYTDGAEHYAAVINQENFDRILNLADKQKTIYGGGNNAETRYIQPTVLDGVSWDDAVMQEEIFGPVLPVISFNGFDEALEKISEREKPLAAYLFSKDKEQTEAFLSRVSAGGCCINDAMMHVSSERLPFGGVGNSGMGHYHGEFGFLAFSHQKSVLERAYWGEPDVKYPPYSETKMKLMKKFF